MNEGLDRIVELQHAIKDALPPELRHLVNDLDDATVTLWTAGQDRLVAANAAHLPHRAAEIRGAAEHVLAGDADPTLKKCCGHY